VNGVDLQNWMNAESVADPVLCMNVAVKIFLQENVTVTVTSLTNAVSAVVMILPVLIVQVYLMVTMH
jgi:hypothetical protein